MAKNTCAGCRRRITHWVCNDPDRCPRCYEPKGRVAGSIQCRCQTYMPVGLRNNDRDDRPSPAVRYGN